MACKNVHGVADGTGKRWGNGISETEHKARKAHVTGNDSAISSKWCCKQNKSRINVTYFLNQRWIKS